MDNLVCSVNQRNFLPILIGNRCFYRLRIGIRLIIFFTSNTYYLKVKGHNMWIMKKVQTAKYTKFLFQTVKNVAETVFFCRVLRNYTQLYNRNFTGKYLWRLYHSQSPGTRFCYNYVFVKRKLRSILISSGYHCIVQTKFLLYLHIRTTQNDTLKRILNNQFLCIITRINHSS